MTYSRRLIERNKTFKSLFGTLLPLSINPLAETQMEQDTFLSSWQDTLWYAKWSGIFLKRKDVWKDSTGNTIFALTCEARVKRKHWEEKIGGRAGWCDRCALLRRLSSLHRLKQYRISARHNSTTTHNNSNQKENRKSLREHCCKFRGF